MSPGSKRKIPYAFSAETYDIHSRVWTTPLHAIGRRVGDLVDEARVSCGDRMQDEYAALAALTAIDAKPTVAKASQQWTKHMMVAHCDVLWRVIYLGDLLRVGADWS